MQTSTTAKPKLITQFDSPWKNILDIYFADCMHLCWPTAYASIDWSKKPIMLDKELQSLMKDNTIGNRIADKLVKVYLKDGTEHYVLLHVEIQQNRHCSYLQSKLLTNYAFMRCI